MKNKHSNTTQLPLNLVFTLFFTFIICSSSYGQIGLASEKLTINNFNTSAGKTDSPAAERPRIVGKRNQEENKSGSADQAKIIVVKSEAAQPAASAMLSQLERQAFDILNQRRNENGLAPLHWSDDMAKIARLHSQDMAQYNYFSHSGRDGTMVNDRAYVLGFSDWRAIGENIAFTRGYDKPAEFACENWMKSPSHRENILNARWKDAGIGIALASDGSYYFTEVFMVR